MTAGALLTRLLAVTPPPPDGEDLEALLVMAATMTSARESLLAETTPPIATPAEAQLFAELQTRQRAWDAVLATACRRIEQQRLGATRVRAYAATLAAGCR